MGMEKIRELTPKEKFDLIRKLGFRDAVCKILSYEYGLDKIGRNETTNGQAVPTFNKPKEMKLC